jgi:formiminotetrahydrofolate cyclodeaminase
VTDNQHSDIAEMDIEVYLTKLAASDSTPGGGAAAGITGAQAAALLSMVCALTQGKKYADISPTILDIQSKCRQVMNDMIVLSAEDAHVFNAVMAAYRLPKTTEYEISERKNVIQKSLENAAKVPLTVMQQLVSLLPLANQLAEIGNPSLISDVGVAFHLIEASIHSSRLNVLINVRNMLSERQATTLIDSTSKLMQMLDDHKSAILEKVEAGVS